MKRTLAVQALLLATSQAVKISTEPDVYGPNGQDYTNESANYDMSLIGIDITTHGHGGKCETGKWATVHWTGSLKDGRVFTDSRLEPGALPKTFALGASNVWKCWDMAIAQLHAGDKAHVSCPSSLVYGTAKVVAPLGDDAVPKGSDVDFDIEVVDCNIPPVKTTPETYAQPKTTTMQPDTCFYLHLTESEHTSLDLVLATQEDDWANWWPGKWANLEQYVKDDPAQQWYFNEKDGSLHNAANPNYTLDEHQGWLFVANTNHGKGDTVEPDFPAHPRKWYYDGVEQALTTEINGIKTQAAIWGQPKQWAWAEVGPSEGLGVGPSGKWRIEYCFDR